LFFVTSAFSANADPTFTSQGLGSSIYIFANNNSNSAYSCNIQFNYAEWDAVGSPQNGSCNYPYYDSTPINSTNYDGTCYYLMNKGSSASLNGNGNANVKANVSNNLFYTAQTRSLAAGNYLAPQIVGNIRSSCSVLLKEQAINFQIPNNTVQINTAISFDATGEEWAIL
jgi:hypothetical protein